MCVLLLIPLNRSTGGSTGGLPERTGIHGGPPAAAEHPDDGTAVAPKGRRRRADDPRGHAPHVKICKNWVRVVIVAVSGCVSE